MGATLTGQKDKKKKKKKKKQKRKQEERRETKRKTKKICPQKNKKKKKKKEIWDREGKGVEYEAYLLQKKQKKKKKTICRTICTEHLLNAGRRPQISQKGKKTSHNWVEQKEKRGRERKGKKESEWDQHYWEGAVRDQRNQHTGRPPN